MRKMSSKKQTEELNFEESEESSDDEDDDAAIVSGPLNDKPSPLTPSEGTEVDKLTLAVSLSNCHMRGPAASAGHHQATRGPAARGHHQATHSRAASAGHHQCYVFVLSWYRALTCTNVSSLFVLPARLFALTGLILDLAAISILSSYVPLCASSLTFPYLYRLSHTYVAFLL
jgi:hypothetical protein